MEVKFFTESGKILDLTGQKISIQENNSAVNESAFSKYIFPFEISQDSKFKNYFGDFESYESTGLKNQIPGMMLIEYKISKSKLNIDEVEGSALVGQVDFGFEELPNWDKPLKELPLEKYNVDDIYTYAKTICEKKYPQTNFNFPRIYTPKYSPDDSLWDAFNGYYNDLNEEGTEMRRNYIDSEGEIFNQNIIHPCPHVLYLLKLCFSDAGYELAGEILDEPLLAQRWVFSGTEYFSRLTQRRLGLNVLEMDYDSGGNFSAMIYAKTITIEKAGTYRVKGFFNHKNVKTDRVSQILLNGQEIWYVSLWTYDETIVPYDFNIDIPDNSTLSFILRRGSDPFGSATVIVADVIGDQLDLGPGEDNGVITNLNEIDLSKAVPEMTCGEYINRIRNWLNYDMVLENRTITMNKLNKTPENVKDATHLEVERPRRKLLAKKSFKLGFQELDNSEKLSSMFIDSTGATLNKLENKDTTVIEIDGYAMPVGRFRDKEYLTAQVKKDSTSTLALVWYEGLTDGQNNAQNPPGLHHPELYYSHWNRWIPQRINGVEFNWKVFVKPEELGITIKDYIFCYQNIHIIKSWTKDLVEGIYEIDLLTETVR